MSYNLAKDLERMLRDMQNPEIQEKKKLEERRKERREEELDKAVL